LYGLEESHPVLPVSKHYGEKLLAIMGGRVHETVKFLGRVPGDVVASRIACWDVAVLNPKGFGESESVSMKDCWRESVPVIAGSRFGQRDYMPLFPTLASSSPRSISRILWDLSLDQTQLAILQAQSRREYELVFERGLRSVKLWEDLVLTIAEGRSLVLSGMKTTHASTRLRVYIFIEGIQLQLQVLASKILSRFKSIRY
jgi:hypothetical protein